MLTLSDLLGSQHPRSSLASSVAPAVDVLRNRLAGRGRFNLPVEPTTKQQEFLSLYCREALYGGAAGGGKTMALIAAAFQHTDVPGYSALLLRRTYRDLALPGVLMDLSNQWLAGTEVRWNGIEYRWTFPSGATVSFGYLDTDRNKYRYQSSEFQFIGFDELTQFPEGSYLYLFSRLRERMEWPRLLASAKVQFERFQPRLVLVEERASGISLIQALVGETLFPVLPVKAETSKLARTTSISSLVESGRLWIPEGFVWADALLQECAMFPAGAHDDQVDALTHALRYFMLREGETMVVPYEVPISISPDLDNLDRDIWQP